MRFYVILLTSPLKCTVRGAQAEPTPLSASRNGYPACVLPAFWSRIVEDDAVSNLSDGSALRLRAWDALLSDSLAETCAAQGLCGALGFR